MIDTLNHKLFTSIRGRFILTTVALVFGVVSVTLFAQWQNQSLERATAENIFARNQLLEKSRLIRDAVWRGRETLTAFLLDPYQADLNTKHRAALTEAISLANSLKSQTWIVAQNKSDIVTKLETAVLKLDSATRELIDTRLNATKQYPSLYFASFTLNPLHRDFFSNVSLALEELESSKLTPKKFETYKLFISARNTWTQMVSNFRMYLANRMGSFDPKTLATQEQDVELLYDGLQSIIAKLSRLDKTGQLDFQGSSSVEQFQIAMKAWYEGFQDIKRINASDDWRADAKLLKQNVMPNINEVWNILIALDQAIEQSATEDVNTMGDMASTQTNILWMLTIMGIMVIGAIFFLLDSMLLKPLASVASALNNEAKGVPATELPSSKATEMQHLLDAFSEMRKQVHQRQMALEHQATHDTLTGLPNRSLLLDRIQHAIAKGKRYNKPMAFMMMDLDRFKEVNDTLGHIVGDKLLVTLAQRLNELLRQVDTVARLGGDEFGILLEDTNAEQAAIVAQKILKTLEKSVEIDSHTLFLGGSIGIAIYPEHGDSPENLMQHSDVAMYIAKQNRLGYTYYDAALDKHTVGRMALMTDLRKAIAHDNLALYYQPKISLTSGKLVGAEALLRWVHPDRGMIPPDQVIPVAEHTGLIRPLTLWVLDKAIMQAKHWLNSGLELNVAVNISAFNLQDKEFENEVKGRLSYHDLPPHLLTLEVTESAMMANASQAAETLSNLDNIGVHISIDDYGTGFSSLAYLKQLPVDELKIDKSFVFGMLTAENEGIIVQSTIDLAHNLGLKIVAEGIENQSVLQRLKEWRCDVGQGYHIGRPMPAADFIKWTQSDHYLEIQKIAQHNAGQG